RRRYVLAAAVGHTRGVFTVGGKPVDVPMQDFTGFVGQWDSRVVDGRIVDPDHLVPAFIKRDPIAWVGTHRHGPDGKNEPYVFCYLFKYAIDLPEGTKSVVLPDNRRIRILAATVAADVNDDARPAALLYD
ncbi:MAG: alpha-mannosidase, partial [Planctomycetes bacterium]|nr:alpha-mannosidase [Planctomycetota bacterium]